MRWRRARASAVGEWPGESTKGYQKSRKYDLTGEKKRDQKKGSGTI